MTGIDDSLGPYSSKYGILINHPAKDSEIWLQITTNLVPKLRDAILSSSTQQEAKERLISTTISTAQQLIANTAFLLSLFPCLLLAITSNNPTSETSTRSLLNNEQDTQIFLMSFMAYQHILIEKLSLNPKLFDLDPEEIAKTYIRQQGHTPPEANKAPAP